MAKQSAKTASQQALEKGLPSNVDTERLVLGATMLNDTHFQQLNSALEPADFMLEKHRRIFGRMKELHDRGERIDRVTVAEELIRHGQLESVDGLAYLSSLDDGLPEQPNVDSYLRMLRRLGVERKMIFLAKSLAMGAINRTGDPETALGTAMARMLELQERLAPEDKAVFTPSEVMHQMGVEQFLSPWLSAPGIPTGYPKLDDMIGGLVPGVVHVIAADTSFGKTAYVVNILSNLLQRDEPVPCLYFTGEMRMHKVIYRMASGQARVPMGRFVRNLLNPDERQRYHAAISDITNYPLYLDESAPITIHNVCVRARRGVQKNGVKVVVIDYLQMMDLSESGDGRQFKDEYSAVSYISKRLVQLAKDLNVVVIYLSQFSRAKRSRDKSDRRPKLSDLHGSSALEKDSGVVLAIYREEFDRPNNEALKNTAELIILKNRDGARGTLYMDYRPTWMTFEETDRTGPAGGTA